MWEVAHRRYPYKDAASEVIPVCVQHGDREEFEVECPEGYGALVQQCWHPDPTQRPVIDTILVDISHLQRQFQVCHGTRRGRVG